jgi:hypothetical protein
MPKTIDVNIDIDVDYKSIEDLKSEINKLEAEFNTLSVGSDRWKELGNQIKAAKTQLKDIDLQFEALDAEQRGAAIVDSFRGVVGIFEAAGGALAALGIESDALEDIEKRVLGLAVAANGLRDLSDGIIGFRKVLPGVSESVKGLGNSIKGAFTTGTGAVNGFRVALASIGIGVAIAAVYALVEAFDQLSSVDKTVQIELEDTNNKIDALDKNFIQASNSILDIKTAFDNFINTLNDVKTGTKDINDLKTSFELLAKVVPSIKKLDITKPEDIELIKQLENQLKDLEVAQALYNSSVEVSKKLQEDSVKNFGEQKKLSKEIQLLEEKTPSNRLAAALQQSKINDLKKQENELIKEAAEIDGKLTKNRQSITLYTEEYNDALKPVLLTEEKIEKLTKQREEAAKKAIDLTKQRKALEEDTTRALAEALRVQREAQTKGDVKLAEVQKQNNLERLEEQKKLEISKAQEQGILTTKVKENIEKKYNALRVVEELKLQKQLYDLNIVWFEKRLDAFKVLQDIEKQRNEASEQAEERLLDKRLTLQATYLDNMIKMTKDEVEKVYLERLKLVGDEKKANMAVIKTINDTKEARIQAAKDAKQAALNAGQTEIMAEKEYQETLIDINNETNAEIELQEEQHAAKLVSIDLDTQNKINDNRKTKLKEYANYFAQTLRILGDLYSNFIDMEAQLSAQRTDRIIEQLERERQARLKQLELESRDVITQSDIRQAQVDKINEEYDKRQRDLEAKQFDYEKQLKTSQTIINGIVGASQIVASQAANPVLMGISLAALAATTAGQVAVIQDQKLPEYAIGGMVEGPGTGTSDSILARLSNGEFVVNAKATQQYLPVLKAINEGKTDNTMFDTSRLESVLSRLENKMSEPSKAYIVQNDLYNSVRSQQQLNNRRKL